MIHHPVVFIGTPPYCFLTPRNGGKDLKVFLGGITAQKQLMSVAPPPILGRGGGSKNTPKISKKKSNRNCPVTSF
jgi:hypothetical protein